MKYFLQVILCLLLSSQIVQAQLACNDFVNVSLDSNGEATLSPDVFLEGNPCSNCEISVFDNSGTLLGTGAVFTFICDHINMGLTYEIEDLDNGNLCWGNVFVEDKLLVCDFGAPALVINGLCNVGDFDLVANGTDVLTEFSDCIRLIDNLQAGINTISINSNSIDNLNGISTLDLVLMRSAFMEGFNSPMDAVLTDIDNDGTVSTSDLINIRKAILGSPTAPTLGSLRIFNSNDPFTGFDPFGFTNNYQTLDIDADYFTSNNNFSVDIRLLADINNSAFDGLTNDQDLDDRSEKTIVYDDINMLPGETYTVNFKLEHKNLQALTVGLVIKDAQVVGINGLSNENELLTYIEGEQANLSFLGLDVDELDFTLEFKSQTTGNLSDVISINENILSDLVDLNLEEFSINLEANALTNNSNPRVQKELKIFPNPSRGSASVIFPSNYGNEEKHIQMYNSTGKLIFETKTFDQQYQLEHNMKIHSGVYIVRVLSGNDVSQVKLILQ